MRVRPREVPSYKAAVRPCFALPDTDATTPAGLTWLYTDAAGGRLATVYASITFGGCAADFSDHADMGGAACLHVGGGLPALPLTAPEADHPLSWHQVCAEIEARLVLAGWDIRTSPELRT